MKKHLVDLFFITIGALIAAFSIEGFLIPNQIIDGGIMGISIMASYVTKVQLGIFTFFLNLPFIILAFNKFGKEFVLKSLWAVTVLSLSFTLFETVTSTKEPILAIAFGGVMLGIGVGLVLRYSAAMDGTEIISVKLAENSSFSVGEFIMFFNIFIFIVAGFVYNWDKSMYSLLTYYIAFQTIDIVIEGLNESKSVNVISDFANQIGQTLIEQLNTSVTYIDAKGGYSGADKRIIYCVISRLEVQKLKNIVKSIDPTAFIAIEDVHDVDGVRVKKKGHI